MQGKPGTCNLDDFDMKLCRSIFLLFAILLGFTLTVSSCSSYCCYSFLFLSTSFTTTDASKRNERHVTSRSDSERTLIDNIKGRGNKGRSRDSGDRELFLRLLSAFNEIRKWRHFNENNTLGVDFARGTKSRSSVDICGLHSLGEHKCEQNSKYYVDVLKDYMFAVLYSGVVFVTFMGLLARSI